MALPEQPSLGSPTVFGLPAHTVEHLGNAFTNHESIESVTLYGSRANGNYRYNSDIDLLLTAPEMTWAEFNRLECDIDDLLLPWKVDLALKHHVENQNLLAHVERIGIVIYQRRPDPSVF
ncbi:MAG: nucleotidyltransferase domain-containing protein [Marinobacter sp.]|uniref:nucleotidyltransferase family protein n=1 Tax=Marinobacter sp. TaxID=50741 RepID=UPI0034A03B20